MGIRHRVCDVLFIGLGTLASNVFFKETGQRHFVQTFLGKRCKKQHVLSILNWIWNHIELNEGLLYLHVQSLLTNINENVIFRTQFLKPESGTRNNFLLSFIHTWITTNLILSIEVKYYTCNFMCLQPQNVNRVPRIHGWGPSGDFRHPGDARATGSA